MAVSYLLLFLGGFCLCGASGNEFAVVFMQNFLPQNGDPRLQVTLAALGNTTRVNVSVLDGTFDKAFTLIPGFPKTITLPADSELQGSVRSNKTVVFRSTGDVSVVAENSRLHTRGTWFVRPVADWGLKYYSFTPDSGPSGTFAQIAIINGPKTNTIKLTLSALVYLEDKNCYPGVPVQLSLGPWEAVQLQSTQSLSGSCIISQEPVGVFAGHSCAQKNTHCNHVCMQLLPVSSWGFNFVVPPIHFQNATNAIYILPSVETFVQIKIGDRLLNKTLVRRRVEELHVNSSTPVFISSAARLMVLFHGSDGVYKSLPYDAFLINLVPEEQFCSRYTLVSMPGYKNFAFLIAHKDSVPELTFNGTSLPNNKWGHFSGTDMMYARIYFGQRGGYVAAQSDNPFGIFTVGIAMMNTYAVSGVCLDKGNSLPSGTTYVAPPILKDVSFRPFVCMTWGGIHYLTLRGAFLAQTVNCTTVLMALAEHDGDLPPFAVVRKSDLTLRIRAFGKMLDIPTTKPRNMMVDGAQKYLPAMLQDGRVNLTLQGLLTKVSFSFGLQVIFGPHGLLHLQMDRNSRMLDGICTGYTSKDHDNSKEGNGRYGPTWQMSYEPICDFRDQPQYEECSSSKADVKKPCQILEESEVFNECHVVMDPKPFVSSCKLSVCEHGTSNGCIALEAYALACGIEGVNVTGWRNLAQCAHQCPLNSHYESCSPCVDSGSGCDGKMCYEACVCQDGYNLEMGVCIPYNQSGCMWDGSYYPHGMEFLSSDCQTWCRCAGPKGRVECHRVEGCGLGYTCGLNRGWWSCNAIKQLSCSVYGGSHYVPFDGNSYIIEAPCCSRVVGLCAPIPGLEYFNVHIVNAQRGQGSVYTKAIDITVHGFNLTLSQEDNGRVEAAGILLHTSLLLNGGRVELLKSGVGGVLLQSDFGLSVSFEADGRLLVSIPVSYVDAVCGLCVAIPQICSEKESCCNICHGADCVACNETEYKLYGSPKNCGMLKDPRGPFNECHKLISYKNYFEGCLHDMCQQEASEATLCNVLASYTAACQEAGAVVDSWRTDTFCNIKCPLNSHYELCATSCPRTCTGLDSPPCTLHCRESCSCDPSYVLSGEDCVLLEECGCLHNGRYLKRGEFLYSEDCSELCECHWGNLTCKNQTCHAGEKCMSNQGVRGCFLEKLTCWVSSSFAYYTFDDTVFDASGTCSHAMGTLCEPSNLTNFVVELWTTNSGDHLERLERVVLDLHGHMIWISRDSKVQVDNMDRPPPFVLEDGKIMLSRQHLTIQITTDFGLVFLYNPSWISLQLPMSYKGKVCGLCGNANQNGTNSTGLSKDFPSLKPAYTNGGGCADMVNLTLETLSYPSQYEDKKYCGSLLMQEGDFRACHDVISPESYFKICVLLMEMENGSKESLLQSLKSYSDACQNAGAIVHPWNYILLGLLEYTDERLKCVIDPNNPGCVVPNYMSCSIFSNFTYIKFNGDGIESLNSSSSNDSLLHICDLDGYPSSDYFSVRYVAGKNESIQQLLVKVYGMDLVMEKDEPASVLVNGTLAEPPLTLIPDQVWLTRNDFQLILETDLGLSLFYNVQDGVLVVFVPETYVERVCGLCQQPIYHDVVQLPPLNEEYLNCSRRWSEGDSRCSMLLDEDGPFGYCHQSVSPYGYYETCLDIHCHYGVDNALVCQIFQDYVSSCHAQRAYLAPLTTAAFCYFKCPLEQNYTLCMKICKEYCSSKWCFPHCMEGCSCTDDLVWDGMNCVNASTCLNVQSSQEATTPQNYLQCMINPSNITFGNYSSITGVERAYDVLRTCEFASEHWLRVVLLIRPNSQTKLQVFFKQAFITIDSSMTVWVNGQKVHLPFQVLPELSINYADAAVTLDITGELVITFSILGDVHAITTHEFSASLCGACASPDPTSSLDQWQAEDLSWMLAWIVILISSILVRSLGAEENDLVTSALDDDYEDHEMGSGNQDYDHAVCSAQTNGNGIPVIFSVILGICTVTTISNF